MRLIVDSGSTKTEWCLIGDEACYESDGSIMSPGINPVRDDRDTIAHVLGGVCARLPEAEEEMHFDTILGVHADPLPAGPIHLSDRVKALACQVAEVHFYGAGCLPATIPTMQGLLQAFFPAARVHVASDMLGAARALCGSQEGIACILGTGANSCLYDGRDIVANVPALGWILGDEGSGAVLGRTLVADVLKGQLPAPLCHAFLEQYQLTAEAVIQAVYRGPQPNRLLASFVPFLAQHRDEPAISALLTDAFRRFFRRNVLPYGRPDLAVHLVGGVACEFRDEIRAAAQAEGLSVGRILKQPGYALCCYHRNT